MDRSCPSNPTAPTTRWAWVWGICKRASSASHSTYIGDLNSQNSSPEAFSPGFSGEGESSQANIFSAVLPAALGSSGQAMLSSVQLEGPKHLLSDVSSHFLDTFTSMGMNMIQEQLYILQGNIVTFLADVEVNLLSSPEFVMSHVSDQQQTPDPLQTQQLFSLTFNWWIVDKKMSFPSTSGYSQRWTIQRHHHDNRFLCVVSKPYFGLVFFAVKPSLDFLFQKNLLSSNNTVFMY